MIRLSEAIAKLYMDHEVTADYVTMACRLLTSSILKIEREPIEFTEAEENAINEMDKLKLSDVAGGANLMVKYQTYSGTRALEQAKRKEERGPEDDSRCLQPDAAKRAGAVQDSIGRGAKEHCYVVRSAMYTLYQT